MLSNSYWTSLPSPQGLTCRSGNKCEWYNCQVAKIRVDLLLVERGLAESRSQAQRMVMAGQVRAEGQVVAKPSSTVRSDIAIEIDQGPPFVSRGGEKLLAALQAFDLKIAGKICADVGASTGGFTDCLLQHGAARVYAIDVGQGILHWKLRQDPKVVLMEDCNARYLDRLPEAIDLVTIDASFISLKTLLPVTKHWFPTLSPGPYPLKSIGIGEAIILIKPQFEAGRSEVSRGEGVIRNPAVHRQVLVDVLSFAQGQGWNVRRLMRSPLLGPKGNAEFLAWLDYPAGVQADLQGLIDPIFT